VTSASSSYTSVIPLYSWSLTVLTRSAIENSYCLAAIWPTYRKSSSLVMLKPFTVFVHSNNL
jgi:hypothetical protein